MKLLFYSIIVVGVIVIILLIARNNLVTGAIAGAIAGGLAVLISFGVIAIVAKIKGIDMYVSKSGAGGTIHDSHSNIEDKNPTKRGKGGFCVILAVVVILGIMILVGVLSVKLYNYLLANAPKSATVTDLAIIKQAAAEIDVAKQEGDNLGKAPTNNSLQNAENDAVFGQELLAGTFPNDILPFALAIHNWGAQMQINASKNNWSKVSDNPDSATIKLSAKDDTDAYNDVVDDLVKFQSFGDYAIAKNNKDAMKWIAGRLHAEEIMLDVLSGASVAEGPKDTAYATTYGPTCYWGRGHVMVSNRSNRTACLKQLTEGIKPLRKAAQNYYKTGSADAAKDWQVALSAIKQQGYPISTTGATVGADNFATPPAMKAFQDFCKAKNGNTPSGGVKDRLPTTESGQTCTYKGPKGGTCWDFLTDSGLPFSGGDGDCPQLNLLPWAMVIVPTVAPPSPSYEQPKSAKTVEKTEAPSTEVPSNNNPAPAQSCEDCDAQSESCYQAWHSQLDACRAESLTPAHINDPNWYNENCYAKINGWQDQCSQQRLACHQRNPGCSYRVSSPGE